MAADQTTSATKKPSQEELEKARELLEKLPLDQFVFIRRRKW